MITFVNLCPKKTVLNIETGPREAAGKRVACVPVSNIRKILLYRISSYRGYTFCKKNLSPSSLNRLCSVIMYLLVVILIFQWSPFQ